MMKVGLDIGAKRAIKNLITNWKRKQEEAENVYEEHFIPKLTKVRKN